MEMYMLWFQYGNVHTTFIGSALCILEGKGEGQYVGGREKEIHQ